MTAELVRGQNHPLDRTRVEIRVAAGGPVVAGVTLGDEQGRLSGAEAVAHPGAPRRTGIEVPRQAAAEHRIAVDLDALPGAVHRVSVLLALPSGIGGLTAFGAAAAPAVTVTGLDGTGLVRYTITGLGAESAVVAVELYRRQDAWKVRAVGQGYADGLPAMLRDQGLAQAAELAAEIEEAVGLGQARAVPAPAPMTAGRAERPGTGPATAPAQDRPSPAPTTAADGPAGSGAGTGPGAGAGAAAVAEPASGPGTGAGAKAATTKGGDLPPSPADGGPIDYQHPRRRSTPAPSAAPAPSASSASPPTPSPSTPDGPPLPVAGDAAGWSMDERLYNQVWGMFEDLARSVAAYRSAADFAESRLEQELDRALADPRNRLGTAGEAARATARDKHATLVTQARAALDRDLAQLMAESEVVEPALPPAFARWDNPVWQGYHVPQERPMALRLGDLHLPEVLDLRIPMLVRLPLERGLWIDSGPDSYGRGGPGPERDIGRRELAGALTDGPPDEAELRRLAMESAVAIAARLLAIHPAGEFAVQVIDPGGTAAPALAPLVESGAMPAYPLPGAKGVAAVLEELTRRVELVRMAVRHRAADALPADLDTAEQLLIVHDFPHGFDDRALTRLRYLADEGPAVGVHLMLVANRAQSREYGPVLDPLWRSLLRLTPVPDAHLADPWVGHAWTYEPPLAPQGSQVVRQVLGRLAEARRAA
ncbi:TerD family protein [Streptomyces tubercidicus]|uniref:Export associated protein n=1 Tax=Streptomyces tubercidicus TaxID=47759 RepID=A0A640UXK6_9ACTN|nr:TerD family protein [Streptomyces tubercidicus]WAU14810.1 TerD family protein [Streptomyces tubercidicus]GFE40599.1 export associated protein [Streptomyces tubercidicus]